MATDRTPTPRRARSLVASRRRRFVLGAVAAVVVAVPVAVVAAPVPPAEVPAGDRPVAGAAGAEARAAVPGLYLPDTVPTRVLPSGDVRVTSGRACASLREIVLAGDWSIVEELRIPAEYAALVAIGGVAPVVVLGQGDDRAFAQLSDGPDGCDGVVGLAEQGDVTFAAGPAVAAGVGWSVTTRCLDDGEGTVFADVVVGGAGAGAQLQLVVSGDGPTRDVALSDSSDGTIGAGPVGVLDLMTDVFAAALAGGDDGDLPPGVIPDGSALLTVEGEGDPIGTAAVEAGDGTLSGTVTIDGFFWTDIATGAGGTGSASFPFACSSIGRISG